MPYAPQLDYHGDRYFSAAAGALGGAITDYKTRKRLERETEGLNETIFNTALRSRDENGNPLVSEEEKQRFLRGDPNTRKGIATGFAARIHQDLQEREAKMRWGRDARDPNEGRPQPLVLPDGTTIPGRYYIPGSRSVIETNPRSAPPALGQEIVPGFIWNGRTLVPTTPRDSKSDALSRFSELSRKSEIDSMDREIARLQGEIAAGEVRWGPDSLPFSTPYAEQLRRLETRRNSLASSSGGARPLVPGGGVPIETDPASGIKFYRDATGAVKPLPNQFQSSTGTSSETSALLERARVLSEPIPVVPKDVLGQARDAVRRGASREAVAARLREMGIDPSGM